MKRLSVILLACLATLALWIAPLVGESPAQELMASLWKPYVFLSLPLYPGDDAQQATMYQVYESPDSPSQVLAYYERALPESGWLLEAKTDLGRRSYLLCSKHESTVLLKIQRHAGGSSFLFSQNMKP